MTTFNLIQFISDGWLQEANRLFFHPRGVALAIETDMDLVPVVERGCLRMKILDGRNDGGYEFGSQSIDDFNDMLTKFARCPMATREPETIRLSE